jgi:hypothetical protein
MLWPDWRAPEMFVRAPDLQQLAKGRRLPHIYGRDRRGTELCLWDPKAREWNHQMRLGQTYLPWTEQWLLYYEDWLFSDDWLGGGVHYGRVQDWRSPCVES